MGSTVIIEYRTRKDYCQCCYQKLPNPKTSDIRDFELSKQNLIEYGNWKEIAEFEEDLEEVVRDYIYNTISFFATSSYENILIENSEFDKVKEFILNEVLK